MRRATHQATLVAIVGVLRASDWLLVAGRVFQALARCRIPGYHAGLSVPRQPGQPALAQRQVDLLYQVL